MTDLVVSTNILTSAWLMGWLVRCVLNLGEQRRRSASFVLILFCLLYGIPIGLDLAIGIPEYVLTPGLRAGVNDESTVLIYNWFVSLFPIILWYSSMANPRGSAGFKAFEVGTLRWPLCILLVSPLPVALLSPKLEMYLVYGAIIQESTTSAAYEHHGFVAMACILSMLSGAALLLVNERLARTLILTLPFTMISIWLQGKRSSVALFLILIWFVGWARGLIRARTLWLHVSVSVLLFSTYIAWYQNTFRPSAVLDGYTTYENSRIDYGRDHHLKAALFSEMPSNEPRILDDRGQSILFSLAMFVPRSQWPDKPLPYAIYMTGFALQSFQANRGWGLTTSILDESVANFGWFGLIIGPSLLIALCRLCDQSCDLIVKLLGTLIACLFLCVEFVAFAPIFFAWILYWRWSRQMEKRTSTSPHHQQRLEPHIEGIAWT